MDEADKDKNGKIDFEEWGDMIGVIKRRIPLAEPHLEQVEELFRMYDSDGDDSLTLNELATLLQDVGNRITALPAVRFSLFFS